MQIKSEFLVSYGRIRLRFPQLISRHYIAEHFAMQGEWIQPHELFNFEPSHDLLQQAKQATWQYNEEHSSRP